MSASRISALRPAHGFPPARLAIGLGLGLLAASCAAGKGDSPVESTVAALTAADATTNAGDLDLLFMIDNSSSMTSMQQKLGSQIPGFISALQGLPGGIPNIHIAVVSSDLGAPGDETASIQCSQAGDQGIFQAGAIAPAAGPGSGGFPDGAGGAGGATGSAAPGCAGVSLNAGATFISNVGGTANYTGDLSELLSCMTQLGEQGCGFEHQLASVARALGADGSPAPVQNAGFLRPGAELAIIFLTNEDDCSAPATTKLYSLNGYQQNISNPLGPIANYRCNQFGHLCVDPAAGGPACLLEPPLVHPADAQEMGTTPTLSLTDCESDDSNGLLTPVGSLVSGIKALKADPTNQIVVGAITAPATPYTVAWAPEAGGQDTNPGELWPEVEHSCGPAGGDDVNPAGQTTIDGSFGDPAVRVVQWVKAFGDNGVSASICDSSYSNAFGAIVSRIGAHLPGGSGSSSSGSDDAGTTGAGAALPICANGISPGLDAGLMSTGGTSGNACTGSGGAVGSGGLAGGRGRSGLGGGGCAVGGSGSHPGAFTLALLGLLLVAGRKRRTSLR